MAPYLLTLLSTSILLALLLVSLVRHSWHLSPSSAVVLWWTGWQTIGSLSLTGLLVPSMRTLWLVWLGAASMTAGGCLVGYPVAQQKISAHTERMNEAFSRHVERLDRWLWLLVPVLGYLVLRVGLYLFRNGTLGYRAIAFGTGGTSVIFGSLRLETLYNLVIEPILLLSAAMSCLVAWRRKRIAVALLPSALLVTDGLMRLGRFAIYYVLFFTVASGLLVYRRHRRRIRRTHRQDLERVFVVLLLVCLVVVGARTVTGLRGGSTALGSIASSVIDYHTVGFVLLDSEMADVGSRLNTLMTLGRCTIGGLDTYVSLTLHSIGFDVEPIAFENGVLHNSEVPVGYGPSGEILTSNAFYTGLYSLYLDGRLPYVMWASFIYGLMVEWTYAHWRRKATLRTAAALLLLLYLGFFSLFQSVLESSQWWGAVLLFSAISLLWSRKRYEVASDRKEALCQEAARPATLEDAERGIQT